MRVALVPMGYGDGIPRHASNDAPRCWSTACAAACSAGSAWTSSSSTAPEAHAGDEVVLFGPGSHGEPTATDWARWCGTIDYEIVTRMGGRQTRVWVEGGRAPSEHPTLPGLRGRRSRRGRARRGRHRRGGRAPGRQGAAGRAAEADRLGVLRSDPIEVTCDDGVVLHAEVDEVAPYADSKTARAQAADDVTLVFVHGYALNLDCWHFQREAFRGKHRMAFYDQRSHGRSGSGRTASTPPSTSSATTWPA